MEELKLIMEPEGLTLTDGNISMRGDFEKMLPRLKQSNLERELLVKAARIKGLGRTQTILDATAGMGEDSLLLAAAGFYVFLYEYDETIYQLLLDTLKRSAKIEGLSEVISRMKLAGSDSVQAMRELTEEIDVIFLDPMFPERQKSGLIKKKFQLLQQLERPCTNEEEMFLAAVSANPYRIVVKRPAKGPYLADKKPSYSLEGKAIRYDCYQIRPVEK